MCLVMQQWLETRNQLREYFQKKIKKNIGIFLDKSEEIAR